MGTVDQVEKRWVMGPLQATGRCEGRSSLRVCLVVSPIDDLGGRAKNGVEETSHTFFGEAIAWIVEVCCFESLDSFGTRQHADTDFAMPSMMCGDLALIMTWFQKGSKRDGGRWRSADGDLDNMSLGFRHALQNPHETASGNGSDQVLVLLLEIWMTALTDKHDLEPLRDWCEGWASSILMNLCFHVFPSFLYSMGTM